MFKLLSAFFVFVLAGITGLAQQPTAAGQPEARSQKGFITPAEVNIRIESDARVLVVMAAVNVAGFDYEPAGQPLSPARAELRKDLANLDPKLKERLASFYKSHRRADVDEVSDAARYAALSLLMTQPPAFSIYQTPERPLPPDLQALLVETDPGGGPRLLALIREFYLKSGFRELLPKYTAISEAYVAGYRRPVGETAFAVLEYFHTRPETIISMRPLVVKSNDPDGIRREKATVVARTRTRQVFVIPDPLGGLETSFARGDILNQKDDFLSRRIGDDYIVVVGPSRTANVGAVRRATIRFVIDPIIERGLRYSLELKDDILKLSNSVATAGSEYKSSVYLVLRESLAQAADARLRLLQAKAGGGSYSEDDAVFDLAQAYSAGAVLSFHFYDALRGYEKVGISLVDAYEQMVATTKFDREAARSKEFEPVMARVSARRARPSKPEAEPAAGAVAEKFLTSDDLIRQRRFGEARVILDQVLLAEPNNARALFGMAQVINQSASPVELDPAADENDKIQAQTDRLERAIKLYRKAIQNASLESERWLIQWSHVLLGRIYDFQEFRNDALVEYDAAIALGEVKNGAYREALEGKRRPYGQKN